MDFWQGKNGSSSISHMKKGWVTTEIMQSWDIKRDAQNYYFFFTSHDVRKHLDIPIVFSKYKNWVLEIGMPYFAIFFWLVNWVYKDELQHCRLHHGVMRWKMYIIWKSEIIDELRQSMSGSAFCLTLQLLSHNYWFPVCVTLGEWPAWKRHIPHKRRQQKLPFISWTWITTSSFIPYFQILRLLWNKLKLWKNSF